MMKTYRFLRFLLVFCFLLFGYSVFADPGFEHWKQNFRQQALAAGVSERTLDATFRHLLLDPKVIERDRHQAEFSRPIWRYLDSAVSTARLEKGSSLLVEHSDLLDKIYQRYGVEPEYLVAIWGIESNFGSNKGKRDIIRSLATLAYDGRRKTFAETELLAALKIIDRGDVMPDAMQGSWAGAMGHTQFIPTTYEKYAIDFDGDGKRDLIHSIPDALASTAHYLAQSGWQTKQAWGHEVRLPETFDWRLADPNQRMSLACWQHIGLTHTIHGQDLRQNSHPTAHSFASLLLPAGYHGPAFMMQDNFRVIKRYNNANSYALAVGLLGNRLAKKPALVTAWPSEDKGLSRTEKKQLQHILTRAGFDTKGVDGLIGPNSQNAIRQWQLSIGIPADGYINKTLLNQLETQFSEIVLALSKEQAEQNTTVNQTKFSIIAQP
ncbi:MAG: lytic murein transglycosylase [bacterium]